MKIFKYWIAEKSKVEIYGEMQEVTTYGGSNISTEDASSKAKEKVEWIKRKIDGESGIFEDYEVEIREEILKTVDDRTIITRNRYGAQVLNTERLMFLDIDKPKISFGNIFKKTSPQQDKEKIFDMVRSLAAGSKYSGLNFRIYETFQGARVIVLGADFNPQERATLDMMKEFNCDALYTTICSKQNCFRARLTPKPQRIHLKPYKVKYPLEARDIQFENWLQTYERESRNFNVCKFIGQAGASQLVPEAVRLHDEMTGASSYLPLA